MKSPFPFFSLDELKCKCGRCGSTGMEMDIDFMERIIELRKLCDFAFPVTSAYRCPSHNDRVSKSGFSGPHTYGKSMDIGVSQERAHKLVGLSYDLCFSGLGINQKGPIQGRFIHLDTLTAEEAPVRPTIWSY